MFVTGNSISPWTEKNTPSRSTNPFLSDTLFIPFKDDTNEKETYEGGRYIDAEILPEYKMVLDFNMAYHPSCAYNDKFVCVLPPRENMLMSRFEPARKILDRSTIRAQRARSICGESKIRSRLAHADFQSCVPDDLIRNRVISPDKT